MHRHHIHLDLAKGTLCGMKGQFEHLIRNRTAKKNTPNPKKQRAQATAK